MPKYTVLKPHLNSQVSPEVLSVGKVVEMTKDEAAWDLERGNVYELQERPSVQEILGVQKSVDTPATPLVTPKTKETLRGRK